MPRADGGWMMFAIESCRTEINQTDIRSPNRTNLFTSIPMGIIAAVNE